VKTAFPVALLAAALAAAGCSLEKVALNKAAGMLSAPSGTNTFTRDNDPELVADALPFAIKFYESMLATIPDHEGLRVRTGSLYIMYASAFLQTPADMVPKAEPERKEALLERAKNLYLRGRDMIVAGLEKRNPRLRSQWKERRYKEAAAPFSRRDVPALYWAAAGWVAAFAINPFDIKLGLTLPQAAALMDRVLELEPGFSGGAVHNFYVLYFGSLPDYMGGDAAKAREHFRMALAASGNRDTSPYLSLASTVDVKEQNIEEFRSLLGKVLDFDPDTAPDNRLVNILNRRKARWLLEHVDDFFLLDDKKDGRDEKRGTP
jgi:predicted anti-sigma-YlaC factor YlaD